MKIVSKMITDLMVNYGAIFNDRDLFEFGLRTFLRNAFIFILSFLVSLYFNFAIAFLAFNISFLILRQCTGGYHAKSIMACFFESLLLSIGIPAFTISFLTYFHPTIILVITLLCSIVLYILTLRIHKQKKNILLMIVFLYNIIIIMSSPYTLQISVSISFAIITNLFFFLLTYAKENV